MKSRIESLIFWKFDINLQIYIFLTLARLIIQNSPYNNFEIFEAPLKYNIESHFHPSNSI